MYRAQGRVWTVMGAPCAHSMQRKRSVGQRPVPGVGRPKPQPRTHGPRCRALYQYVGQDVDELSFNVNEVIEILMEGVCQTPPFLLSCNPHSPKESRSNQTHLEILSSRPSGCRGQKALGLGVPS